MDGAGRGDAGVRRIQRWREGDSALDSYLSLCSDYLKRQILVYRNWPQRRWDAMGYRPSRAPRSKDVQRYDDRVFRDRNT
ncbi:MAG TPA: hypothetical protein VI997_01735 [Candidatus Thermoplasmatota archaeon]|nr:hypothetical protein [Candidatus Thermoplasmatota archaeon]